MATHETVDVWLDRVKDIAPIIGSCSVRGSCLSVLSLPLRRGRVRAGGKASGVLKPCFPPPSQLSPARGEGVEGPGRGGENRELHGPAPIFREDTAEIEEKRSLSRPIVDTMPHEGLLGIQLAPPHTIAGAAQAVDLVHAAADTSALCNEYKFQQYFRDVHTTTQHAFASASRYESVGVRILRVELDWGSFALSAYKYSLCPKVIP
jgi:hypothetical protein